MIFRLGAAAMQPKQRMHSISRKAAETARLVFRNRQVRQLGNDGLADLRGGLAGGSGDGDFQLRVAPQLQCQDAGQDRGLTSAGTAGNHGKILLQGQ